MRLEKPGQCPRPAALGIDLREAVIAIIRLKNVVARRETIPAEGLRKQRVPRVKLEIDKRLWREAHPCRTPAVLCRQGRSSIAGHLAAGDVESRLPRVLAPVLPAIAAVVDVRELQDCPLRNLHSYARGHAGPPVEVRPERFRPVAPLIGKTARIAQGEER